ncbi:NRAMP family divalent metal transporter [Paraburkholderia phosphatilytica]|uniref:NRAMP family divalent metal transporter n=1 Tax=Paraburkholderia phosphatilytica TaxID=2282883 RepID=UPI000E50F630|nr:divalent metal cation transporter [Paraburkholderia phosphatilytica]
MAGSPPSYSSAASHLRWLAACGPGLLVMLADCDAGNVVTAAQSGVQWGYRLLPMLLALIPLLYMVQELTVRLGIFTGCGHGELVRAKLGPGWAWISAFGLSIAVLGSLVTEFTGIAGVGEMIGVSRSVSLPLALAVLVGVVFTGSHRRIDRIAMVIGAFELTFFVVAWRAHPELAQLSRAVADQPFHDPGFAYLIAALIGATFNPWMIFYQQAAVVDRRLGPHDYTAARVETAAGAVLTQLLTAAVLVAAAATLSSSGARHALESVGEISAALSAVLGPRVGRVLFGVGVLGASMVAAIVCSMSLAWGLGEVAGYQRSLDTDTRRAPWFYAVYVVTVAFSAALVWLTPNLVSLNVAAQVVNALMLPLALGTLIALGATTLPRERRPRGVYLWVLVAMGTAVSLAAVAGAVFYFVA